MLKAEKIHVYARPAYSPDMSPAEHVSDALDQCAPQHDPDPANN